MPREYKNASFSITEELKAAAIARANQLYPNVPKNFSVYVRGLIIHDLKACGKYPDEEELMRVEDRHAPYGSGKHKKKAA